jgi:phage repressor protein C with HTH and peptisase S24 domain
MTYKEKKPHLNPENEVSFPFTGIETRIAAVADLYESRKQAAATAQAALSSLQRWIAGEGMPAFDSVALLAAGKNVSLDWIATGLGQMHLEAAGAEPLRAPDDVYVQIPLYDARVSAGHGAWNDSAKVLAMLAFTRYSIRKQGLEPAHLAAFRVDGDSNEPILSDGDTVMVDLRRKEMRGDAMYVICMGGHLFAKRLQLQLDGGFQVISANSAYPPVLVPKGQLDELVIIGRVVWAGGWL